MLLPRHYLRRERERAGKTQAQIAEALEMDSVTYCRIEGGKRRFLAIDAVRAAEFLKIPVARIVGEKEYKAAAARERRIARENRRTQQAA